MSRLLRCKSFRGGDIDGTSSIPMVRAKIEPRRWGPELVQALYSRCHGISDDCKKGCWRHIRAVEGETIDKSSLKGKRDEYNKKLLDRTKSQAELDRDCCRTCRRCVEYEQELRHRNLQAEANQVESRKRHGSTVGAGPITVDHGCYLARRPSYNPHTAASPVLGSCVAFASLAPAAFSPSRSTSQKDLLVASAVKLHYVLRGVKKQIEKRRRLLIGVLDPGASVLEDSHGQCTDRQKLWYVSYTDFCHMLHTSGVNWLTKEQMRGAFKGVDLNNSGGLHLTELAQVIAVTDHDCKQILKGVVSGEEFLEEVLVASETVSLTPRRPGSTSHPVTLVEQIKLLRAIK